MKGFLVVLLGAAAAAFARPALAHYSFSATYLETQSQTIEGENTTGVTRETLMPAISSSSLGRQVATPPTIASEW